MSRWRETLPDLVAASRRAQGLPRQVQDPAVLSKIATLLRPQQTAHPEGRQDERAAVRQAAAS